MNALTRRTQTTVETLLELRAGGRALIVLTDQEPPDTLRVHIAPIFDRLATAQSRAGGSIRNGPADRIALLKELAELRASGILTDAEFAAEKARILSS
jgi:hypothetical protein